MRMLLSTILLASALPANAQVFKCTTGGVTTYSEVPCGDKPKVVELNVHQPSRRDRLDAQQRAMSDRRGVAEIDRERDQLEVERRIERSQRAAVEARHDSKCSGYQARAKAAEHERELYATQRYRDDADRRKKEYEAQHFSECFAR
ncbi:MAG: DUF4124 domain-containing protein [Zoogloea sp.]|nr:DUF4124 domain-containing protein [Zoogloea sp.]